MWLSLRGRGLFLNAVTQINDRLQTASPVKVTQYFSLSKLKDLFLLRVKSGHVDINAKASFKDSFPRINKFGKAAETRKR